jgi:ketosteroid isomerase-like protein
VAPHRHRHENEGCYILTGELLSVVDGERFTAPAGNLGAHPARAVHTWRNAGDSPARFLTLLAPGTFSDWFESACTPEADAEYGIASVGEPPAAETPIGHEARLTDHRVVAVRVDRSRRRYWSLHDRRCGMAPQATSTEETIRQLAQEWMQATKDRDAGVLDRILAEEFVLVAARGVVDRAAWMDATMHQVEVRAFRYEDAQVRVYGEVAVMLTGWHQEATMGGREWSGDFRMTDTWVRRDGRWQVVLRHSTQYR